MKSYFRAWGLLALEVLGAGLLLLALAGGLCLLGGQCAPRPYSTILENLGFIVLGLGGLSLAGTALIGRNGNYQSARTVAVANIAERTRQDNLDSNRRLRFILLTTGAGGLTLLAGLFLAGSFG